MRSRIAGSAAILVLLAACAPTVTVTELDGTFEPRPGLEEVPVYTTQVPECPYREIAIITAFENDLLPGDQLDGVLAALRERARSIGADAVVGVQLVTKGGDSPQSGYSGTAIRFTDDECNTDGRTGETRSRRGRSGPRPAREVGLADTGPVSA